jgi:Flp pilus assembly pilin Flp
MPGRSGSCLVGANLCFENSNMWPLCPWINVTRQKGVCVRIFQCLWRDQRGASLIDYAILAALITTILVAGLSFVASWIQGMWMQLLPMLG